MFTRRTLRPTRVLLGALAASFALAPSGWAQISVHPRVSEPGIHERYAFVVPNARDVPTERVEATFPLGVRVVSVGEVPGWSVEVLRNDAGVVTGAVWTGTLLPGRFVELPFVAMNPSALSRMLWPATQSFADGTRVEWAESPGSETAAPMTETFPAMMHHEMGDESRTGAYLGGGALLVSILALGIALRPR